MNYVRGEIDEHASEIPEVTDKPDLAISCQGRVIGVELSQFPSSYIVKNFRKKGPPAAKGANNEIVGHLAVYPFEPHRWVHQVLEKKHKKVASHQKRIRSDEMWLLMHCHSMINEWPMSKAKNEGTRQAEAALMRFGTTGHRSRFKRIFYIYTDGTVVSLAGGSELIPSKITLPLSAGYPAVTAHKFVLPIEVPLPGLGDREYYFEKIQFTENIVAPMDAWMKGRDPEIERPTFTAFVRVTSNRMYSRIFRNGVLCWHRTHRISSHLAGKTTYIHILEHWSIQQTTFTCDVDDSLVTST